MKYNFKIIKEEKGYSAIGEWTESGQEYHCCTQGDTRGDLLANVIDALDCTFDSDVVESVAWLGEDQIEAVVTR